MGLAELKAELAELEPKLADADISLEAAIAAKDEATKDYEAAKTKAREAAAVRDPIRSRVMALQKEIGIIEGVPTLQIGEGK